MFLYLYLSRHCKVESVPEVYEGSGDSLVPLDPGVLAGHAGHTHSLNTHSL